jgi:hypothetical protein
MTSASHADDPGSNPGDRTMELSLFWKREPSLRENGEVLDFQGCFCGRGMNKSLKWSSVGWGWFRSGPVIEYPSLRGDFVAFLESSRFNSWYVKCMLNYLDKYVTVISGPMDVVRIFSRLTDGQQHNLSRGLRNLFNFLEAQGFDEGYLCVLRKEILKDNCGFVVNIPSQESVYRVCR